MSGVATMSRSHSETFRALVEQASDAVVVVRAGRVADVNERGAAMFGRDAADLVGMPLEELMQIAPPGLDATRTCSEGTGIRRGNAAFPIRLCWADGDGERVYAVCDLTAQKRAEQRLAESERRYRELSEISHDLVCEHDPDGTLLFVTPSAARALGRSPAALVGMNLADLIARCDHTLLETYLANVGRDGVAEGLVRVRTASGKTLIWHYQSALLSSGERPIVRGFGRDVTDREEALRALRHSEWQFRTIIENASDIIGIVDPAGRIEYHSPSMERLLGIAGLAGRTISEFVHDDDLARTIEFFEEQASPGAPNRTIDFRVCDCNRSWRWLSVVMTPVVRGGQTTSIVFNGRDVTDRMLLEAQLEQANRVNGLGRLAATVAHEFNNVLMGIQPFAELLQRPDVSPLLIANAGRYIANSVGRGKRVAMDILRFTHPAEVSLRPVDLSSWWHQFAPELQAGTPHSIKLTWSFATALTVRADAAQLSQVLGNVINNARDAMPHGGKIHVSADRPSPGETFAFGVVPDPETFVHIRVTDNGTGMPENVLLHVFDPLFTTKHNGGTGLGLAVAHQVVSRHRGHIFVESKVGAGATFHIFLPATEAAPVAEPEAPRVGPSPVSRRVLIIDDEPNVAEGLAEVLRIRDITVELAGTGTAGIRIAAEFEPELAIVDIRLPDLDGIEVARRLQAHDPDLRIVFASGHGATESIPLREGVVFLQKPFDVDALLTAMASVEQRRDA